MPLVSTQEYRIFFAHVPKCAGSSVEDYLIRRFGVPLSIRDVTHINGARRRGLNALATHLTSEDLKDFLPQNLSYSFAVVRDPVERTFSQYRFQAGVSRTSRLSFSTWLRVMMRCVQIDPRVYQNHIRPQSDLVPKDAEIFRLEDGFDAMISRLDDVTGSRVSDLQVGHLLNKKSSQAKTVASRQDIDLLQRFYAVDFERFGYQKRDLSKFESDPYVFWRQTLAHALAPGIVVKQRRHWLR